MTAGAGPVAAGPEPRRAAALLLTGVGIARNVIFSLTLAGSGSISGSDAGGGGGMLERSRGMCSD
jgi:hypothetical protein